MHIKNLFKNSLKVSVKKVFSIAYNKLRILKYQILSNCYCIEGKPVYWGPVLLNGAGTIEFKENVNIGVSLSPGFYNTYGYFEARNPTSIISIGDNVYINNNACIISEGEGIIIESDVLIGHNFTAFDSDFHSIDPTKRMSGCQNMARVEIQSNVFIGANVTVLKGVIIGTNSVIASNSVVSKSIPANVVAGGNPCKVIKEISN